jgi:hypothetical protein
MTEKTTISLEIKSQMIVKKINAKVRIKALESNIRLFTKIIELIHEGSESNDKSVKGYALGIFISIWIYFYSLGREIKSLRSTESMTKTTKVVVITTESIVKMEKWVEDLSEVLRTLPAGIENDDKEAFRRLCVIRKITKESSLGSEELTTIKEDLSKAIKKSKNSLKVFPNLFFSGFFK